MQYLFCIWGIILSLLLFLGRPKILMNAGSYLMLWVLYLNHMSAGDRFMQFQWDALLLEAGFLSVFFAPWWHSSLYHTSSSSSVARELLRWLCFRLMVASGIVKLLSRCRTWWSLSALHYHFET